MVVVHCAPFARGLVADDLLVVAYDGGPTAPRRVATVPFTHNGASYRGELHGSLRSKSLAAA